MPGSPLSYKEVIFEALKEWLEEEQVGRPSLVAVEWRSVVRRIRLVGPNCTTFE